MPALKMHSILTGQRVRRESPITPTRPIKGKTQIIHEIKEGEANVSLLYFIPIKKETRRLLGGPLNILSVISIENQEDIQVRRFVCYIITLDLIALG